MIERTRWQLLKALGNDKKKAMGKKSPSVETFVSVSSFAADIFTQCHEVSDQKYSERARVTRVVKILMLRYSFA